MFLPSFVRFSGFVYMRHRIWGRSMPAVVLLWRLFCLAAGSAVAPPIPPLAAAWFRLGAPSAAAMSVPGVLVYAFCLDHFLAPM